MADPVYQGIELLEEINQLDLSDPVSEFTLRRLWHSAQQVAAHDLATGSLAMAMLRGIRHDLEGACRYVEQCASQLGQVHEAWLSQAALLHNLSQDEEAAAKAMGGLEHHPNSPELLRIAIDSLHARGYLSRAAELGRLYEHRVGEDAFLREVRGSWQEIEAVLTARGVTEQDLQDVARLVYEVAFERGVYRRKLVALRTAQDDGEPWVAMLVVPANLEQRQRLRLSRDLVKRLVESELPAFEEGAVVPRFTAQFQKKAAGDE
ncbi:MAG: hypothetical protein ACLFSI_02525 [Halorhodospira sp.]